MHAAVARHRRVPIRDQPQTSLVQPHTSMSADTTAMRTSNGPVSAVLHNRILVATVPATMEVTYVFSGPAFTRLEHFDVEHGVLNMRFSPTSACRDRVSIEHATASH